MDNSIKLSTTIKFHCSFEEKGPVLRERGDCSVLINWETPSACPKYVSLILKTCNELSKITEPARKNLLNFYCSVNDSRLHGNRRIPGTFDITVL